jgi:peptidyl-prolyl cis-trans isomerase SurA
MRNQMEKEGMTFAAFREEIRNEIMMQRLREHEVDNKIQVSDAEVDTYLAAEKAAAAEKVEMDLAQILVGIPANATPEQIAARRARADEVLRQLRTGADFAKMAATYSDAPDALKGGAIGWRDPDRLPPLFAEPLRKTQPGPGHACHQEQYRLPHPQADRQAQPGRRRRNRPWSSRPARATS